MAQQGATDSTRAPGSAALRTAAWHFVEAGDVLDVSEVQADRTHTLNEAGDVLDIVPAGTETTPPRMRRLADTHLIYGA